MVQVLDKDPATTFVVIDEVSWTTGAWEAAGGGLSAKQGEIDMSDLAQIERLMAQYFDGLYLRCGCACAGLSPAGHLRHGQWWSLAQTGAERLSAAGGSNGHRRSQSAIHGPMRLNTFIWRDHIPRWFAHGAPYRGRSFVDL